MKDLKIYAAIVVAFVFCIFLTRLLSMKEQKAIDDKDYAKRYYDAVESVKVEYYKRFAQVAADTAAQEASTQEAFGQPLVGPAGTGTEMPVSRGDSTRCCAEADSLRAVNNSLNVQVAVLARTDSTHFVMKDSATIDVWHIPNLKTFVSRFVVVYKAPPREFDSTVVRKIRDIPVDVGWSTEAVVEFSVAAVLVVEIIRFLLTGVP